MTSDQVFSSLGLGDLASLVRRHVDSIPQSQKEALARAQAAVNVGYWPEHDRLAARPVRELKELARKSRFSTRGCVVKADWIRVIMSDWIAHTYYAAGYEGAKHGGMFPGPTTPRPR